MKRVLIMVVLGCVVFFVAGFALVGLGYLTQSLYLTIGSVAGALASVVGLLSLARPSITKTDIEAIEIDALAKASKVVGELEAARKEKSATAAEIARLEAQKEEMRFLVRKASLALLLRERVEDQHRRIVDHLKSDREFTGLLEAYESEVGKLTALNEEIEEDKNVSLLKEIMRDAELLGRYRERKPQTVLEGLAEALGELMGKVIRP